MSNLLIRLFVKDYKNVGDPTVRLRYGRMAGIMGTVTNMLIAAAKITIGILTASISIIADGINNLSDSAASIVTMVSFQMASKPPDREHPQGHGRMEYVSGVIVSVAIIFVGFELLISSVERCFSPQETDFQIVTVVILGASILIKLWQFFFYRKVSKLIDSTAVKATSQDSLNDIIATSVVLAGLIVSKLIHVDLDGYIGIAVAIFIFVSGALLIKETISPLLGSAPPQELIDSIKHVIIKNNKVLGFYDLAIHNYGEGRCYATVDIEIDSTVSLTETHDIMDTIEGEVLGETGVILTTHPVPAALDEETLSYRKRISSIVKEISTSLGIHEFKMDVSEGKCSFDLQVPFGFEKKEDELIEQIKSSIETSTAFKNVTIKIDRY